MEESAILPCEVDLELGAVFAKQILAILGSQLPGIDASLVRFDRWLSDSDKDWILKLSLHVLVSAAFGLLFFLFLVCFCHS